eukprot:TRINITY_DN121772_c0_g1_i1.p1 TRINITY_DN121772_c0_g1~~TRINITY_DN121772_c0_g1_i1.p1  ORF type:complete len:297 (+),score=12.87 TRINITY_DN121772_c0_g1_i1:162-1052(+)
MPSRREQTARLKRLRGVCLKTKMCKFYLEGSCMDGDRCTYAHAEDDIRDKPDLLYTRLCREWDRTGVCSEGENCRFAHGLDAVRPPLDSQNPPESGAQDDSTATGAGASSAMGERVARQTRDHAADSGSSSSYTDADSNSASDSCVLPVLQESMPSNFPAQRYLQEAIACDPESRQTSSQSSFGVESLEPLGPGRAAGQDGIASVLLATRRYTVDETDASMQRDAVAVTQGHRAPDCHCSESSGEGQDTMLGQPLTTAGLGSISLVQDIHEGREPPDIPAERCTHCGGECGRLISL